MELREVVTSFLDELLSHIYGLEKYAAATVVLGKLDA